MRLIIFKTRVKVNEVNMYVFKRINKSATLRQLVFNIKWLAQLVACCDCRKNWLLINFTKIEDE